MEASSKAHWEDLGLALGCCGSDVPFREAALISSGRVSPSVPGHAGLGTFGISRIHLSHGTWLQLLFSSSEGTSPPGSGEVLGLSVIPVKSCQETSAYSQEGKSLL